MTGPVQSFWGTLYMLPDFSGAGRLNPRRTLCISCA